MKKLCKLCIHLLTAIGTACVILSHTVNKLFIYFNSQCVYSVVIANTKVRETYACYKYT